MARAWIATENYNLPVFCSAGVSHYVPTSVKWEIALMDDGVLISAIVEYTTSEKEWGNA